jgi:hypothetical protein
MKRIALPLALLAAATAVAGDRDAKKPAQVPKDYVKWAANWDEAFREAKERNVPIHVAFHKDN